MVMLKIYNRVFVSTGRGKYNIHQLRKNIIARKKTEQIKMIKFVCYGKKEEYNQ